MPNSFTRLLLTAGLAVGLLLTAHAQTGRIAHFSHSGSLATLASENVLDNFGNPDAHIFFADTITATSDSTAVIQGKVVFMSWGSPVKDSIPRPLTDWVGFGGLFGKDIVGTRLNYYCSCYVATRKEIGKTLKMLYPDAKLIGFDSLTTFPNQVLPDAKKIKAKTKRKKSAFLPTATSPPRRPGVALTVAIILTLAGAGWLLGERRPAQPQAA